MSPLVCRLHNTIISVLHTLLVWFRLIERVIISYLTTSLAIMNIV